MTRIKQYRQLARFFSFPMIRDIVKKDRTDKFKDLTLYLNIRKSRNIRNRDIFQKAYNIIINNYRCEYVYKNQLFNSIMSKYSLANSVVFDEFSIASSIADLVLLNGEMKIYEIKTELDDFSRLPQQISDYKKIANKIYIVTDTNHIKTLLAKYSNTNIGLMLLNDNGNVEIVKSALSDNSLFDYDTIFKVLRKNEYLELVKLFYNLEMNVPNTVVFNKCYDLLKKIDLVEFQSEVIKILKTRNNQDIDCLLSRKTPSQLRYACNSLNMTKKEYIQLFNFLTSNTYVSTLSKREAI